MTPSGSFQGSKRETWVTRGRSAVDADPVEDLPSRGVGEVEVLGAQRVDRRRDDLDSGDGQVGRDELLEREDRGVVDRQERPEERPGLGVRPRRVDVAAPDPLGRARAAAATGSAAG